MSRHTGRPPPPAQLPRTATGALVVRRAFEHQGIEYPVGAELGAGDLPAIVVSFLTARGVFGPPTATGAPSAPPPDPDPPITEPERGELEDDDHGEA